MERILPRPCRRRGPVAVSRAGRRIAGLGEFTAVTMNVSGCLLGRQLVRSLRAERASRRLHSHFQQMSERSDKVLTIIWTKRTLDPQSQVGRAVVLSAAWRWPSRGVGTASERKI